MIGALDKGLKGDPAGVLTHYTELVRLFPNDERAQTLLGNTYFGRQEYDKAITHYVKATTINPSFSQPYNQLGYAYRFIEKFDDTEKTFKKYTELIPDDPNPYDSYAELLMKIGRFEESIKMYEKALSVDRHFIASHIGIGNNYLAMGQPEKARAAFANITTPWPETPVSAGRQSSGPRRRTFTKVRPRRPSRNCARCPRWPRRMAIAPSCRAT